MTQVPIDEKKPSTPNPTNGPNPEATALPPRPAAIPVWQQRLMGFANTIAVPFNAFAVRRGLNPFAPVPLDQELAKAAKILESFGPGTTDTIPPSSISSAAALIIITTGRLGLRKMSCSTGSGIAMTRRASDGKWASPVAIRTYGVGGGLFALGMDVTDRVYVVNSREALASEFLVGPEAVFAAGKYGAGGGVAFEGWFPNWKGKDTTTAPAGGVGKKEIECKCGECGHQQVHEVPCQGQAETVSTTGNTNTGGGAQRDMRESLKHPIQCYMRSKGLYAGLQAEGTVLVERAAENAAFYGRAVSMLQDNELGSEKAMSPENAAAVKKLMDGVAKAEGESRTG